MKPCFFKSNYLTPMQWRHAVYLWEIGRDTHQIAKLMKVQQAFIHNRLPHYRKVFKGASEVDRAVNS